MKHIRLELSSAHGSSITSGHMVDSIKMISVVVDSDAEPSAPLSGPVVSWDLLGPSSPEEASDQPILGLSPPSDKPILLSGGAAPQPEVDVAQAVLGNMDPEWRSLTRSSSSISLNSDIDTDAIPHSLVNMQVLRQRTIAGVEKLLSKVAVALVEDYMSGALNFYRANQGPDNEIPELTGAVLCLNYWVAIRPSRSFAPIASFRSVGRRFVSLYSFEFVG
jgi:hypothetical protein